MPSRDTGGRPQPKRTNNQPYRCCPPCAADEVASACATDHRVVACTAIEHVRAAVACQRIGSRSRLGPLDAGIVVAVCVAGVDGGAGELAIRSTLLQAGSRCRCPTSIRVSPPRADQCIVALRRRPVLTPELPVEDPPAAEPMRLRVRQRIALAHRRPSLRSPSKAIVIAEAEAE